MAVTVSYTEAIEHFTDYWNRVVQNREIVRVTRCDSEDIVLVAADELESLLETAYLFRTPENAARLNAAHARALSRAEQPTSLEDLRREVGLGADEGRTT